MLKVVVLTGAGISAESGIATFRDADGLWEGHDVMEVASPQGWYKNQDLVLEFYNQRRKVAQDAKPNPGHYALAKFQEDFDTTIVTQNIDDLHEQAGSEKVLHLHGKLFESRSTADESLVYPIEGWELKKGDLCSKGSQLRPNIVWFGEAVPMMEVAAKLAAEADIFLVVGTSLVVYPAAGLVDCVPFEAPVYVIDPKLPDVANRPKLHLFEEKAGTGVEKVRNLLKERHL